MEPTTGAGAGNPFAALGQRLRKARHDRGLTQENLAGAEFTKGYISALERGAVRPSLKALELFSRRLDVPITYLLQATPEEGGADDPRLLEQALQSRAVYAAMLIRGNRGAVALAVIEDMDTLTAPQRERLSPPALYLAPMLRARAYLQQGRLDTALAQAETALALVAGDDELTTEVRDLLGLIYYRMEQPQSALEQHQQCLTSIRGALVNNSELILSVYRNIANDYWALEDYTHAAAIYAEALAATAGITDLAGQARAAASRAVSFREVNDWQRAALNATLANASYSAADARSSVASFCLNLAEMTIEEGRYDDAAQLLAQAGELLTASGDRGLQSFLNSYLALLALRQGRLDDAATFAAQAILQAEGQDATDNHAGAGPFDDRSRALAEALHMAAQIEMARGDLDAADLAFQQALAAADAAGLDDSAAAISFSYAEMLKSRNDFQRAVEYYRQAARSHSRQRRVLGS